MQLNLKTLVVAMGIALGSTGAYAQVVTVPTTIPDTVPNADTDNGGLIFTIFSVNEATPWSYSVNLGLRMNDLLEASTDMASDGKELSWVLPSLNEVGNIADLRWHVTAGDLGNAQNANSARYLTTSVLDAVTGNNQGVISAANNYFQFVTALNAVGGTPDVTTDPADPRFAAARYGVGSNIFQFATAGSVTDALAFFMMTNPARGGTGNASVDRYESLAGNIGRWTLDLASNTLNWTVPGGAPVPLPAAVWMLLSGLAGMVAVVRRKNSA